MTNWKDIESICRTFGEERSEIERHLGERAPHGRNFWMEAAGEIKRLRTALDSAQGYLLNAKIDLETGAPKRTAIMTIDGGLRMVRAALSPQCPRPVNCRVAGKGVPAADCIAAGECGCDLNPALAPHQQASGTD